MHDDGVFNDCQFSNEEQVNSLEYDILYKLFVIVFECGYIHGDLNCGNLLMDTNTGNIKFNSLTSRYGLSCHITYYICIYQIFNYLTTSIFYFYEIFYFYFYNL